MRIKLLAFAFGIFVWSVGQLPVHAANFINADLVCPESGKVLLPPGDGQIRLTDIVLSSNVATDVIIQFYGGQAPNRNAVKVFLDANSTFTTNLTDNFESDKDQGLRVFCSGSGTVSLTVSGSRAF
jgi:hypothetical protein